MAMEGEKRMKSKKIKQYCNMIVFSLGVISAIMLIKFSDMPNYFNIKWLYKPDGEWTIFISILTSYVVTVVFYFFMNFIPDIVKEQEEKEISLPYKCCMHRDIQLFISDILFMWGEVIKFSAGEKSKINLSEIRSVSDMFSENVIMSSAAQVKLLEKSNRTNARGEKHIWINTIRCDLTSINNRGKEILKKYSKDIPTEVYFSINRLLNSSPLIGYMFFVYPFIKLSADNESSLYECICDDKKDL